MPDKIFDDFKFQNYHNEKGMESNRVPNSVKMLEQWVLGVPLTGSLGYKEIAEHSEVQYIKKTAANKDDMQQPQIPKKRAANKDDMQQPQKPKKSKR